MNFFKKSGNKSSIVDEVQKNINNAPSIDSTSWYKEAFEAVSKQDLNWDANQDTLKALDEIRTEDQHFSM